MKCSKCPLYSCWNNENDRGESCGLFGDAWDSRFQYEDKEGNIVGCYIDRHLIEKADEEYLSNLEVMEDFKKGLSEDDWEWLNDRKTD